MKCKLLVAILLLSFITGCEDLEPMPIAARPTVDLKAPLEGQQIPFDTPFVVVADALAPEGGSLSRVELVFSGAFNETFHSELIGPQGQLQIDVTIPGSGHRGPDVLPLDLTVIAEAVVDGKRVVGLPNTVSLAVVDRTRPTLSVLFSPSTVSPPAGFDRAYPPGSAFTIIAQATDPVGGIMSITVDAPDFVGGRRTRSFMQAAEGSLEVRLDPPANADIEITAWVVDAATEPNESEERFRVRVGAGGADARPPEITFLGATAAECGGQYFLTTRAVDEASGIEQLHVEGEGYSQTVYGPSATEPLQLVASATITVPRGPVRQLVFEGTARDLLANEAGPVSHRVPMVDTHPPTLALSNLPPAVVSPGTTWGVHLVGEETCGEIASANALFTDGIMRLSSTTTIAQQQLDGLVDFAVPSFLCVANPLTVTVELVDSRGLESFPIEVVLSGVDTVPPNATISTFIPGGGLSPGESLNAEVQISDGQSSVRSTTVTMSAVGLDLSSAIQEVSRSWPGNDCANRGPHTIPIATTIPPDVRFTAPTGAIQIAADVTDGFGHQQTESILVPITDSAPPEITYLTPTGGQVVGAGDVIPTSIQVFDINHDVENLGLVVTGPASIDTPGSTTASVLVGTRSATVSFTLLVDATAGPNEPISVVAAANDTSSPPNTGSATLQLQTCGAPSVATLSPDLGPVSGGQEILLTGNGFLASTDFVLDSTPLENVVILSATSARARIPAGPYSPGEVDLLVSNTCGTTTPSMVLFDAYRFVGAPAAEIVRPIAGQTALAGDEVAVVFAAEGDGVALTDLAIEIVGHAPVSANAGAVAATLDAVLLIPTSTTGEVTIRATATDTFGQTTITEGLLAQTPPTVVRLHLMSERSSIAVGEQLGISVLAEQSDGYLRHVTPLAALVSGNPGVAGLSSDQVVGVSPGSTTLSATYGGETADLPIAVVDEGLVFAHGDLLLSPLLSGTGTVAAAQLELLLLAAGQATDVTGLAAITTQNATVATYAAGRLTAVAEGRTTLHATHVATTTHSISLPILVSSSLDVPFGSTYHVPTAQRFASGVVAGTVIAHRPPAAQSTWRVEVEPGGTLQVAATGVIRAAGASGFSPHGGRGGPGAGGGGAGTAATGARGGFGEPSGDNTADDLTTTPGGHGGGVLASGGSGARALTGSGGAGGGAAGSGGAGGHAIGDMPATAGFGRGTTPLGGGGGGGGRRGGGGGGGGGLIQLDLSQAVLQMDGRIEASGGAGGARVGTEGTGGGGGGGGAIVVSAATLSGRGLFVVRGGCGGATGPLTTGNRGSGGGGGGGLVTLSVTGALSPYLDVDRCGGKGAEATGSAVPGADGQFGRVQR